VRGREAAASYLAKVAGGPAVTMQALAAAGDRACELWALDALKQRSLLTADVLVDRAMHDPDPVVALWCARSLADPSGELRPHAGCGCSHRPGRAFAPSLPGTSAMTS